MKIRKSYVGVVFTLVVGYFLVYYAMHSIDVYVPVSTPQANDNFVIVLDAGHGGMDGGGTSVNGALEKDINLSIVLKVRDMCESFGYKVVVTRDTDKSIHNDGVKGVRKQKLSDMDNRLAIFNKYDNSINLSIHQNLYTQPQYNGAQMFFAKSNPSNEKLANIMRSEFVAQIQPKNTRETKEVGKELYLCYFTKNPSLMIECGFLSNPEEAAKLETEEYQSQVAFTIFSGINKFLSSNK